MAYAKEGLQVAKREASTDTFWGFLNALESCERIRPKLDEATSTFKTGASREIDAQAAAARGQLKSGEFSSKWFKVALCSGIPFGLLYGLFVLPNDEKFQHDMGGQLAWIIPLCIIGGVFNGAVSGAVIATIVAPIWHFAGKAVQTPLLEQKLAELDSVKQRIAAL